MDFAKNLRDARKRLNLTQVELGNMIGRKQKDVSRYERGATLPRIALVPIIARVLNVGIDDLLN